MKVIWSLQSIRTYDQIVSWIVEEWGLQSANKFMDEVDRILILISGNPMMFKRSKKFKNVRIGYLTADNSLVYRIGNKAIELILFWDNRMDVRKLKY